MKTSLRPGRLIPVALGLLLLTVAGCQTWVPEVGMTLPSGHYLKHPPQYIPSGDEFPLTKELNRMEEQSKVGAGGEAP